jgi:predicted dehydrogenase
MAKRQINVGIVGWGFAGPVFHAPVVDAVPGMKTIAILKRSGSPSDTLWPGAKTVTSMEEFLAISDLDLVVVASPTYNHFEIASQVIHAKKHVVVDKPFTVTQAEALRLTDLAKRAGVICSVYHNRRRVLPRRQHCCDNRAIADGITMS